MAEHLARLIEDAPREDVERAQLEAELKLLHSAAPAPVDRPIFSPPLAVGRLPT